MTTLHAFLLAGALHLDPAQTRDYTEVTRAIADVVAREEPLFKNDVDRFRTASLVEAVAWREGSLRLRVRGDCDESAPGEACKGQPHSFCFAQIHDSAGGSEALNEDPEKCAEKLLALLRRSMRQCPSAPMSAYASGPMACDNARAVRISRDRFALAHRIYVSALGSVAEPDAAGRP